MITRSQQGALTVSLLESLSGTPTQCFIVSHICICIVFPRNTDSPAGDFLSFLNIFLVGFFFTITSGQSDKKLAGQRNAVGAY